MDQSFWTHLKNRTFELLVTIGTKIIYAAIALIVGLIIIRLLKNLINRIMKKTDVELSLQSFIRSLSNFILYLILIAVIGIVLGIEASAFVTAVGAAGIAIGLALQGSLANFAGGVIILAFKPFRIGDWVEINGSFGVVDSIDILYTRLKTFDERILTFPNGTVANTKIDNWTQTELRRINLHFQIPLEEDVNEVRDIMLKTMNDHPNVLKDPAASVWLDSIDEYAMNIYARSFCKNELYYPTIWNHLENIKKALDEKGIKIQVPRREIVYEKNREQLVKGESK